MKKVKIMLLAITVLATTGGVLAFKANSVKSAGYCTVAVPSGGDCSNENCPSGSTIQRKTTASGGTELCYTITTGSSCSTLKCSSKSLIDLQ